MRLAAVLGRHSLAKLTPQQVQALYSGKLGAGPSSTTVHHIHATLHTALESAVALTSMAVEALRRHRIRQEDMRSNAGMAWQDNGLVFTDALGGPLEGRYVLRHYFRPLLRRAGLPIIRFHDLRHTMATLLLAQGIPSKVVSEMLGHTTVGITLDLYSHDLPQMQREAARTLEQLLRQE